MKQLAGNSCGTSPREVPSATTAAASPSWHRCPRARPRPLAGASIAPYGSPSAFPHLKLLGTVLAGGGGERACCPPTANLSQRSSCRPTGRRPASAASTRPFLEHFSFPSPRLTVLSAEKGNFSITAAKLISDLHWMDLCSHPLLFKLEPVASQHLASPVGLVSCINCVTCFTLYRPVLQRIYRHSFLCMVPFPVTPEKSSHYCTNSIFIFFFSSSWCTFNLKQQQKNTFAMFHAYC